MNEEERAEGIATARASLERAEAQLAVAGLSVYERLLSGYDPGGCMAEVIREVRFRRVPRQCGVPGSFPAFGGTVRYCAHHIDDVRNMERAAAHARDALDAAISARVIAPARPEEPGVYVVYDEAARRAKIGRTGQRTKRIAALRAGAAGQLRLLAWIPSDAPWALEARLHSHFGDVRITPRGEWFAVADPDQFVERVHGAMRTEDAA